METPRIAFFEVDPFQEAQFRDSLEGRAELVFYPHRLTFNAMEDALKADYIVCFIYSDLSGPMLDKLPDLKGIITMSVGTDHIDLEEATRRHILVANVPAYGPNTVAEHAMALLLAMARDLIHAVERTREGEYQFTGLKGWDIANKTLGIIGTGKIGARVAKAALGLEMKVVAYDPHPNQELTDKLGIEYMSLNELLAQADVITLHVPLTKETKYMLSKEQFALMKKGVVIINTARGGLIDPDALLEALESGIVCQAGLDVLEDEGLLKQSDNFHEKHMLEHDYIVALADHALMHHPNVILTPHSAFNSKESVHNIVDTSIKNIEGMLDKTPVNVLTH